MFVRIKKNSGTLNRSVLVCHNVRHNEEVHQITARIFGHSKQELELKLLVTKAKEWIKTHGSQWKQQTLPVKRRKKMTSRISIDNRLCCINKNKKYIFPNSFKFYLTT